MKILNKKYFESMKKYRDDNNLQNELTDDDVFAMQICFQFILKLQIKNIRLMKCFKLMIL